MFFVAMGQNLGNENQERLTRFSRMSLILANSQKILENQDCSEHVRMSVAEGVRHLEMLTDVNESDNDSESID